LELVDPFKQLERRDYAVIYADPPWQFKAWSHRGEGKGASQHYDCMNLAALKALPVASIAAKDAALFMWVVQPQLPEAMEVLQAWGFEFKTVAFAWIKMPSKWSAGLFNTRINPRLGLGYHTRSGMEQCWLAFRGKGYKRVNQGIEQVIHSPLREHSRKPDEIADRIGLLVGDVPKIELFARESREGWASWGKQREKYDAVYAGDGVGL
jgi:N6-adenosine-specific RNA methylase IME4